MIVMYDASVADRSGPTYPITPEWQRKVIEQLGARGARAALARSIGCKESTLSVLLGPRARHSVLVPAIHKHFGWPPPQDPEESAEVPADGPDAEMRAIWRRLDQAQRERAVTILRASFDLK